MRQVTITLLLFIGSIGAKAQENAAMTILSNVKNGIASFYHDKFEGRLTATGEVFDNDKFTAASNKLKLGTYVKVTNLSNGEVVYVRINDRMAPTNKRLIDLASIAAEKLDFRKKGITKVKVEVVPEEEGRLAILEQKGKRPEQKNEM